MIHASGECTALAASTDATTHLLFTSFVHEGSQSDESWLKVNEAKTARKALKPSVLSCESSKA